jgi:hypothetical protein
MEWIQCWSEDDVLSVGNIIINVKGYDDLLYSASLLLPLGNINWLFTAAAFFATLYFCGT